jgi:HEAT repeat protein
LASAATNGPPEEKVNAIEGLTSAPARLAPIVVQTVADPNMGVRAVSAMAIGKAQVHAAAPRLRPLLNDSSPQVRAAAMYGLKRCGENVDLTPLASMLLDASPRVRAQAAFLLGELGERSAVGLLKDAGKRSIGKAEAAQVHILDLQLAEARIKLGDETPLPEVRAALFPAKPEDLEAAALACQIVGNLRDAPSANRLMELLAPVEDRKQLMPAEIRLGAASALAKLGLTDRDPSHTKGAYIADQYRNNPREALRVQAALVYGDIGDGANLPLLVDMMNDPLGRVRVAAATAIVRITEGGGAGVTQAQP